MMHVLLSGIDGEHFPVQMGNIFLHCVWKMGPIFLHCLEQMVYDRWGRFAYIVQSRWCMTDGEHFLTLSRTDGEWPMGNIFLHCLRFRTDGEHFPALCLADGTHFPTLSRTDSVRFQTLSMTDGEHFPDMSRTDGEHFPALSRTDVYDKWGTFSCSV